MNGIVFIWILVSPFVVVGCLKGRYALSIVGLFLLFGIPAILAGARLARPDSWWAKRKYDEDQPPERATDIRATAGSTTLLHSNWGNACER